MSHFQPSSHVLYMGIGGGMDCFGCLPLFFDNPCKENAYIWNLTFTSLKTLSAAARAHVAFPLYKTWIWEITSGPWKGDKEDESYSYFPERKLALALHRSIFVLVAYDTWGEIPPRGLHPLPTIVELSCFLADFLQKKKIEEVNLIDGGCDSLMTGKELGLGTPSEDLFTMQVMQRAALKQSIPIKLALIGVDVDTAHGIKLKDLNRRLRYLNPLWTWNWSLSEQCVVQYRDIFYRCDPQNSIVHSLVV